jgi:KUP system potassium uptake protein
VVLSIVSTERPTVPPDERIDVTPLGGGVHQIVVRFGYMDPPDLMTALRRVSIGSTPLDVDNATFFLGRETVASIPEGEMSQWRDQLFVVLHRGAASASRFYHLPGAQVFEVGTQVDI